MYRMNCHLTDVIAARLSDYCERAGVPKVTVITMALDQYLTEQEIKRKILDQLADPEKMAEICKIVGLPASGSKQQASGSASFLLD